MRYKMRGLLQISAFIVGALLIAGLSIIGLSVSGNETDNNQDQLQPSDSVVLEVDDSAKEGLPSGQEDGSVSEETSSIDEYNGFPIIETGDSGYELTDDERTLVECAVMCEAGGECVEGQMMVAQSILDGSLRNNYTIDETISKYDIATIGHSYVTDEVKESVSRVFDDGERITEHKTDLWYNPSITVSRWHEQQEYVITVGSHRFFWMNSDMT